MATNNYVSNAGGGFQGPQSDYWMYGLGDMAPARDQAAHEQDQVHQNYLNQLTAQKEKQTQEEYMRNIGMRQAADQAATSKSTLEDLTAQQGINEAPMRAKKSMQELYDGMEESKRTKMMNEMKFIGEHGQEFLDRISNIEDPAEKNKVWASFMETYGGDTTGMERWSPNNEKKIAKVYETYVKNPEFRRLVAQKEEQHGYDVELENIKGQWGVDAANARADNSERIASKRIASKVRGKGPDGRPGDFVTYQNGDSEWLPVDEGIVDVATQKENTQREKDQAYVNKVERAVAKKDAKQPLTKEERMLALEVLNTAGPYAKAKRNLGDATAAKPAARTATPAPAKKTLDMKDLVKQSGYPYEPDKYMYRQGPDGEIQRAPKG